MKKFNASFALVLATSALTVGCAFKMPPVDPSNMIPECEGLRGQDDSGGDKLTAGCYAEHGSRKLEVRRRVREHEEAQEQRRAEREDGGGTLRVKAPPALLPEAEEEDPGERLIVASLAPVPTGERSQSWAVCRGPFSATCMFGYDLTLKNECRSERYEVVSQDLAPRSGNGNLAKIWVETQGGEPRPAWVIAAPLNGQQYNAGYFKFDGNMTSTAPITVHVYSTFNGQVRSHPARRLRTITLFGNSPKGLPWRNGVWGHEDAEWQQPLRCKFQGF